MKLKRTMAIFIDFVFASFITSVIFWPIDYLFQIENRGLFDFIQNSFFAILLLSKDVLFKGKSVGKIVCKLELVNLENENPKFLNKLLRNLTICIYPIEIIMLLFDRRIGDMIFQTRVVERK